MATTPLSLEDEQPPLPVANPEDAASAGVRVRVGGHANVERRGRRRRSELRGALGDNVEHGLKGGARVACEDDQLPRRVGELEGAVRPVEHMRGNAEDRTDVREEAEVFLVLDARRGVRQRVGAGDRGALPLRRRQAPESSVEDVPAAYPV
eukprot:6213298-Pleurochrysis_carterae.AAC.7